MTDFAPTTSTHMTSNDSQVRDYKKDKESLRKIIESIGEDYKRILEINKSKMETGELSLSYPDNLRKVCCTTAVEIIRHKKLEECAALVLTNSLFKMNNKKSGDVVYLRNPQTPQIFYRIAPWKRKKIDFKSCVTVMKWGLDQKLDDNLHNMIILVLMVIVSPGADGDTENERRLAVEVLAFVLLERFMNMFNELGGLVRR